MSGRALDFDRRGDDVREELPREEALLEEALREDRPSAELLLPLADLDALLLLEPLLFLELPVDHFSLCCCFRTVHLQRMSVGRTNVNYCSFVICCWILKASESPFPVYYCAMNTPAPQDANSIGTCR